MNAGKRAFILTMGGEQEEKWFNCKFLLLSIDYSAEVWQFHLHEICMKHENDCGNYAWNCRPCGIIATILVFKFVFN